MFISIFTRAVILSVFTAKALASDLAVRAPLVDACPGYKATNVRTTATTLSADLVLAGEACNVYGPDLEHLSLQVTYETENRIRVKIADAEGTRYQVPEEVLARPGASARSQSSTIEFKYKKSPFSFSIVRKRTREVLFDTSNYPLVFEAQYLRVKTALPTNANIYGLGEHTHTFRLPSDNTTRPMWGRDSFGVPVGTNLYGDHPIYFEHRVSGTHGVFLLNSNAMDIKLLTEGDQTSLEYNAVGGILDFYFLAGPTPTKVAQQYAAIVGLPAEIPYWGLGFHQCRYGYNNYVELQEVIASYRAAGIPLETMWTDIDYMLDRLVFTVDPDYFPLDKMREIVADLHANDQHYIVMVDPAVGVRPGISEAYDRGSAADIWMKEPNGTDHLGIVWPGVVVWPDWFHPDASSYWSNEFQLFFNPETGIDIDGVWIDMNEPASFCNYPCDDPYEQAAAQGLPPVRTTPPPNAPPTTNSSLAVRSPKPMVKRDTGYPDILNPPYSVANSLPYLSDRTAHVDVVHANGLIEYDTHNLYGTMMSTITHDAMAQRRPGLRTFVITRSTFAGAGAKVGKWLGDNLSEWAQYRFSIAGMLGFASIYQVPNVGSDICGFGGNTTETLCARWAMLGAFNPFYRNHNIFDGIPQEFYRWPLVAEAAKVAIDIRYRLLDYFYTAFHKAHVDGTPVLQPLWFKYPTDANTFGIDLQFLYGESILVSPVTAENETSVDIYLPDDIFYDFNTFAPVRGTGSTISLTNVTFTEIPLHIRGGVILPLRVESGMTTAEVRTKDFELVVAPGKDGKASGSLYLDDGVSVEQDSTLELSFKYERRTLTVKATGDFSVGNLKIARVRVLNVERNPGECVVGGHRLRGDQMTYDATSKSLVVQTSAALGSTFTVQINN